MVLQRNRRLSVRVGGSLLLLGLAVVAASVVAGALIAVLVVVAHTMLFESPPSTRVGFAILAAASVGVLGVVAWSERRAPEHLIASLGAVPADESDRPDLFATVRTLAQQADVPVPAVYVAPTETPLSLTTGYTPESARLVVSEGLLDTVEGAELEAVLAHEFAHVANRDTAIMTAATLPIDAANRAAELLRGETPGVEHGQPSRVTYADVLLLAGMILCPPVWLFGRAFWASFSRVREVAADRGAVAITGDPLALAAALQRLDRAIADRPTTDLRKVAVAAFSIVESDRDVPEEGLARLRRPLSRLFATHPATASRVDRLRELGHDGARESDE